VGLGIAFLAAVLGAALVWLTLLRRSRVHYASGGTGTRAEHARAAKVAALMLLGLGVGFFLIFAVAELAGGDSAGGQHLPPAAVLAALMWLGWKRPHTAGVVLLALAVPLGVAFVVGVAVEAVRPEERWVALPILLVPVLTALLLLRAGRGDRRRHG
jgi:hypothetical protein